ncbi:MAG: PilZ domain-containing protein [Pseudomonadota bacterium]
MPTAALTPQAKQKRAEVEQILSNLEACVRQKLPPIVAVLVQGCKGDVMKTIQKDIDAVKSLIRRANPDVMRWGSTADRLRYQNILRNFDAQMRSAELRQQDKERRRFSRLQLDLPTTVTYGQAKTRATAVTLTIEGVRLQAEHSPEVGIPVTLDIEQGVQLRQVRGKVAWIRDIEGGGCESGVRFLALDEDEKKEIRRFLNELEKSADSAPPPRPDRDRRRHIPLN